MNGVAPSVMLMRTGAKHLCTAYAMTNVLAIAPPASRRALRADSPQPTARRMATTSRPLCVTEWKLYGWLIVNYLGSSMIFMHNFLNCND